MTRKMCSRGGWTLVELTLTIAVAAILSTGLGRVIGNTIEMAVDNRTYLVAMNLAKRQMSIMSNAAYPAVAAEASVGADSVYTTLFVTQQVTSVATSTNPWSGASNSIRLITVRVRQGSATGTVLVRLDTYRSDLITFGNGS